VATLADARSVLAKKDGRGEVLLRFSRRNGNALRSHIVVWQRDLKTSTAR
jgi:hypothetical protein